MMYVVRRAFRNYGQMVVPGSTAEPGTIKRFKSRLADGHIVEVSEQDFDKWDSYFTARFGVSIKALKDSAECDNQDVECDNQDVECDNQDVECDNQDAKQPEGAESEVKQPEDTCNNDAPQTAKAKVVAKSTSK